MSSYSVNASDLKGVIPDPVPGSEGGFLIQLVLSTASSQQRSQSYTDVDMTSHCITLKG